MRITLSLPALQLPAGLEKRRLREIVRKSCQVALPEVFDRKGRGVALEIVFVSDRKIQELNERYRGKAVPTDVLSFGDFGSLRTVRQSSALTLELGTLVLSLPFIRRSAKEDGVSWEREFVYVFSHGVLHLLGFDHEARMFEIQDEVTDMFAPIDPNKKYL